MKCGTPSSRIACLATLPLFAFTTAWADKQDAAVRQQYATHAAAQIPLPPGEGPFYRMEMELVQQATALTQSATSPAGQSTPSDGVQSAEAADATPGQSDSEQQADAAVSQDATESKQEKPSEKVIAAPTMIVPRGVPAVIAWGTIDGADSQTSSKAASHLPPKYRLEVTVHRRSEDDTVTLSAVWRNTSEFVDLGNSQSRWTTRAFRTTRKVVMGKKSLLELGSHAAETKPIKTALKLIVVEVDAQQLQAERSRSQSRR